MHGEALRVWTGPFSRDCPTPKPQPRSHRPQPRKCRVSVPTEKRDRQTLQPPPPKVRLQKRAETTPPAPFGHGVVCDGGEGGCHHRREKCRLRSEAPGTPLSQCQSLALPSRADVQCAGRCHWGRPWGLWGPADGGQSSPKERLTCATCVCVSATRPPPPRVQRTIKSSKRAVGTGVFAVRCARQMFCSSSDLVNSVPKKYGWTK